MARAETSVNPFPANAVTFLPHLPNGVHIVVRENHALPLVAVNVVVRGGSASDSVRSGVAHLLEHLCFQGTRHYTGSLAPQLALETEGGWCTAATTRDATCFYGQIASVKADLLINVLADIVLNPVLSEAACQRESELIDREIERMYEDPCLELIDFAYAATYRRCSYAYSALGNAGDLSGITPATIRSHHDRWYGPKNLTVIVVGDIAATQARDLVRTAFGPAVSSLSSPPVSTSVESVDNAEPMDANRDRHIASSYQALVFSTAAGANLSMTVSLELLKQLLLDGPDALLPKRWLADGITCMRYGIEYQPLRYAGRWIIWAELAPGQADRWRESTLETLRQASAAAISPAAFELARQFIQLRFSTGNETYTQQVETLAFYEGLGDARLACQVIPVLRMITRESLRQIVPAHCLARVSLGHP